MSLASISVGLQTVKGIGMTTFRFLPFFSRGVPIVVLPRQNGMEYYYWYPLIAHSSATHCNTCDETMVSQQGRLGGGEYQELKPLTTSLSKYIFGIPLLHASLVPTSIRQYIPTLQPLFHTTVTDPYKSSSSILSLDLQSILSKAILLLKRTFQPSLIRKKRKHGFLAR